MKDFKFKRLLIALIMFGLLIIVAAGLSSLALKWWAEDWLEQQGLAVEISDLEIGILDLQLTLDNITAKNQQGYGFAVEHFAVDIAWLPLLNKQLLIESVQLVGARLDINTTDDGLFFGGIQTQGAENHQQQTVSNQTDSHDPDWQVTVQHKKLNRIEVCSYQPSAKAVCGKVNEFHLQGYINLQLGKTIALTIDEDNLLLLQGISIKDASNNAQLMRLEQFMVDNFSFTQGQGVIADWLVMEKFEALATNNQVQQHSHIVRFDNIELDKLILDVTSGLAIENVNISVLDLSLLRDKQQRWQIMQLLDHYLPPGEVGENDSPETSKQHFRINKLTATSKALEFVDLSQPQPLILNARLEKLQVAGIDSSQPQQLNDLLLALWLGDHGLLSLEGKLQLLQSKPDIDLQGSLKRFDLRPLGVLVKSGFGHRIQSGMLDGDIKLKANQGKLDSVFITQIKHLTLKPADGSGNPAVDAQLGIPLDTALDLLRDKDNTISLELPIKGDISSPEFDFSDVITKAATSALTTAAINYYTPFGLVNAAQGLYDLATAVSIEPLPFRPGVVTLESAQRKILAKLLTLMQERQQLSVRICGYTNQEDLKESLASSVLSLLTRPEKFKATEQQLAEVTKLAEKRAQEVRAYLQQQGISLERMVICEGGFAADGFAGVKIAF
jgi:outer membrane protein OmpA-like peptidoglycan-associated protein